MAFENLLASLKQMNESISSFASNVDAAAATSIPKLDEIANKSDQVHHRAGWLEDDTATMGKTLDVFDGLLDQSMEKQNWFSSQFELDMQQVRLGSIDIRDFIQQWGDAVIATGDGVRTIRELFSGADLGQYRQQIQELIQDVQSGADGLEKVLAFLKENAGDLAKGLINVLELFKAGKASLEDVQRVLDATKAAFPGEESDALVEAIRNALLGGNL